MFLNKIQAFIFTTFIFFGSPISTKAQSSDTILSVTALEDNIRMRMAALSFIKPDKAIIQQPQGLHTFYAKLHNLKNKKKGKVNIVHLGDSHIQAGYLSGIIRRSLQQLYGNGGRGMVFPYRLAKSNGPHDYVSFSASSWKHTRNVFANDTLPAGISGFAISSNDTSCSFGISLRNNEGIDYSFNQLQLFSNKNYPGSFTISDSAGSIMANSDTAFHAKYISSYSFPQYVSAFNAILINADSNEAVVVYGINLLNDSTGVVYHSLGVNGAEFRHFLYQPFFWEQLKSLDADLFILSLGTNESFTKKFDENLFRQTVDSTVKNLIAINPASCILITSPAESCIRIKRRRYKSNPNVARVRDVLKDYCLQYNIAFFDLYECAGGKGSMLKFAQRKMSDARRIHFNRTGYEIQGLMLLDALLNNAGN